MSGRLMDSMRPVKSVVFSFSQEPTYIFDIAAPRGISTVSTCTTNEGFSVEGTATTSSSNAGVAATLPAVLAVSASDQSIKIYDIETLGLSRPALVGHTARISRIEFSRHQPALLFSCAEDGTVRLWDLRAPASNVDASTWRARKSEGLLSLSLNASETMLVAGSSLSGGAATLQFWDLRSNKRLGQFQDSHSDDVTHVDFHPEVDSVLVSGSTDGLICTYDLSRSSVLNEEEAIVSVCNSGSSVARCGFFGANLDMLFCQTHIETLSLWKAGDGQLLKDFGDVRSGFGSELGIEYIVSCQYDQPRQVLHLVTGTHSGAIGMFVIEGDIVQCLGMLQGGHTATVRSLHWDTNRNILISGSEDSTLTLWSTNLPPPQPVPSNRGRHASMLRNLRAAPY